MEGYLFYRTQIAGKMWNYLWSIGFHEAYKEEIISYSKVCGLNFTAHFEIQFQAGDIIFIDTTACGVFLSYIF